MSDIRIIKRSLSLARSRKGVGVMPRSTFLTGAQVKQLTDVAFLSNGRALIRAILKYYSLDSSDRRNAFFTEDLAKKFEAFDKVGKASLALDITNLIRDLSEKHGIDVVRKEVERVIKGGRKDVIQER